MTKEFIEWWKNHRHSGFCLGRDPRLNREVYRWNMSPETAYLILRYRVEFEDQTGISTGLSEEQFNLFNASEKASWRYDQAAADEGAAEYGFTSDSEKNRKIWDANFKDGVAIMAENLARGHSVSEPLPKKAA